MIRICLVLLIVLHLMEKIATSNVIKIQHLSLHDFEIDGNWNSESATSIDWSSILNGYRNTKIHHSKSNQNQCTKTDTKFASDYLSSGVFCDTFGNDEQSKFPTNIKHELDCCPRKWVPLEIKPIEKHKTHDLTNIYYVTSNIHLVLCTAFERINTNAATYIDIELNKNINNNSLIVDPILCNTSIGLEWKCMYPNRTNGDLQISFKITSHNISNNFIIISEWNTATKQFVNIRKETMSNAENKYYYQSKDNAFEAAMNNKQINASPFGYICDINNTLTICPTIHNIGAFYETCIDFEKLGYQSMNFNTITINSRSTNTGVYKDTSGVIFHDVYVDLSKTHAFRNSYKKQKHSRNMLQIHSGALGKSKLSNSNSQSVSQSKSSSSSNSYPHSKSSSSSQPVPKGKSPHSKSNSHPHSKSSSVEITTTYPTNQPTSKPTPNPTELPTEVPFTELPTASKPIHNPATTPIQPTPTEQPVSSPIQPSTSLQPATIPTQQPANVPIQPTPSLQPATNPTTKAPISPAAPPTIQPVTSTSNSPSSTPSSTPSSNPSTVDPTVKPTRAPLLPDQTHNPTITPTPNPTDYPTDYPTITPTIDPTTSPTSMSNRLEFYIIYNETRDKYWQKDPITYGELIEEALFISLREVTGKSMRYEDKDLYVNETWKHGGIVDYKTCYAFNEKIQWMYYEDCPYMSDINSLEYGGQFAAVSEFHLVSDNDVIGFKNFVKQNIRTQECFSEFSKTLNKLTSSHRRRLQPTIKDNTIVIAIFVLDFPQTNSPTINPGAAIIHPPSISPPPTLAPTSNVDMDAPVPYFGMGMGEFIGLIVGLCVLCICIIALIYWLSVHNKKNDYIYMGSNRKHAGETTDEEDEDGYTDNETGHGLLTTEKQSENGMAYGFNEDDYLSKAQKQEKKITPGAPNESYSNKEQNQCGLGNEDKDSSLNNDENQLIEDNVSDNYDNDHEEKEILINVDMVNNEQDMLGMNNVFEDTIKKNINSESKCITSKESQLNDNITIAVDNNQENEVDNKEQDKVDMLGIINIFEQNENIKTSDENKENEHAQLNILDSVKEGDREADRRISMDKLKQAKIVEQHRHKFEVVDENNNDKIGNKANDKQNMNLRIQHEENKNDENVEPGMNDDNNNNLDVSVKSDSVNDDEDNKQNENGTILVEFFNNVNVKKRGKDIIEGGVQYKEHRGVDRKRSINKLKQSKVVEKHRDKFEVGEINNDEIGVDRKKSITKLKESKVVNKNRDKFEQMIKQEQNKKQGAKKSKKSKKRLNKNDD